MPTTDPADGRARATRRAFLGGAVALSALVTLGACGFVGVSRDVDQEDPEDARAASAIKLALIEAEGVDAAAIGVDAAEDGAVTLGGFVASEAEREKALAAARSAAGGRQLIDEIEVRGD